MTRLLTSLLLSCFSHIMYAQVSYEKLPKKELEEIMSYMADFATIPRTEAYVAITPDGKVYNKQTYQPPKISGDSIKYDGTPERELIYRSIIPVRESMQLYVYNGNMLVLQGLVDVRAYMKGQPVKYKVARLETHVKINGNWQMAAGSGTVVGTPVPDNGR